MKRIKELENVLADVLAVIPHDETFSGVGENYLEIIEHAKEILNKKKVVKKRFAVIKNDRNGKKVRSIYFKNLKDAADYTRETFGVVAIEEIGVGILWERNQIDR